MTPVGQQLHVVKEVKNRFYFWKQDTLIHLSMEHSILQYNPYASNATVFNRIK